MTTSVPTQTVPTQSIEEFAAEYQRMLLEMMASGESPQRVLDHLATELEPHLGGRCSILVYRADSGSLHHAAAPSLPPAYCRAIDGVHIGPTAGSCGTAAYRKQPVVVTDVMTDPLWVDYRALAVEHGFRACWSTPVMSPDGDVLGTFAVYHDQPHTPTLAQVDRLSEFSHLTSVALRHARLYSRLAASERRFRGSFEDNAAAMAILSPTGELIATNENLTAMLGVTETDVIGRLFVDFVDPDEAQRMISLIERCVTDSVSISDFAVTLRTDTTGPTIALGAISPMVDVWQEVENLCVSLIDVTARYHADEERFARSVAEWAREAAEAASTAKSEFLNAMSHELRIPLTSIRGYSELIGSLNLSRGQQTEAAESIELAASHLLNLVDDVLDLARIEAGVAIVDTTTVAVRAVLDEVVQIAAPLAQKRGVCIALDADESLTAEIDARRLRQAVLNVVSNAIKYGREQGLVEIAAFGAGPSRVIRIRDDGNGIPDTLRDRIFEPFTRAASNGASNDAEGSGLGLGVARQLLELMDGTIDVANRDDSSGTVVTITLPAA
jgi:PAS domain S-box-containing protein